MIRLFLGHLVLTPVGVANDYHSVASYISDLL
jgi:hypothetical protein